MNFLKKLFGLIKTCNRCNCDTPTEKCIPHSGYDDYGYQCISCATDSGLLEEYIQKQERKKFKIDRRKEFGL